MTTITLKLENDLKKHAQLLAEKTGVSLSSLIKMLLKQVIRSGRIQLDLNQPNTYNTKPQRGDLDFTDLKGAIKYLKEQSD